jgi:cell fate (sporulation/competence/biofilm development) regulator YlbF (YheA/YmcA/DUF963 family)
VQLGAPAVDGHWPSLNSNQIPLLPTTRFCGVLTAAKLKTTEQVLEGPAERKTMTATTANDLIIVKTRELCQTIVNQPQFQTIRQQIDAFLADETAKGQYQSVVEKGDILQQKQQMGLALTEAEIEDFEKDRQTMANNPLAQGFLNAQEELHRVQAAVTQYLTKTFELGRVPNQEDFSDGSCGHGCGCHH